MERVGREQLRKENVQRDTVGYKSRKERQKKKRRERRFSQPKGRLTQAERVRALSVKDL